MVDTARNFGGSMPEYYDSIMGPAQFEPFGADLARRLPPDPGGDVLEIACGSGRVTRRLRERLEPKIRLVASDISSAMLDYAGRKVAGDNAFGLMFVPDKAGAIGEARRVLREGGVFLFNVWDGLEQNPHGAAAAKVLEGLYPGDPEMKFGSLPYLFNDQRQIRQLLEAAGFREVRSEPVRIACSCPSARLYATGQLRGTPRGALLEQRGASLDDVIGKVAAELAQVGGAEPFNFTAQALLVEARAG